MERKTVSESEFPKFIREEYPADKPWMGFFKLWLDAKGFDYGDNAQHIVDGPGDGGIDAIAFPPYGHTELPIVVIQSKYYRSKIPEHSFNAFIRAVEVFKLGTKYDFEDWLSTVKNKSLKTAYRDLWPKRHNIEFVIVTSGYLGKKSIVAANKLKIRIEDKKKVKAVFLDLARGKSPRPESILLYTSSKIIPIQKNKEHNLYVFSAKLSGFANAYQNEKKNLFAGNVRYALPGKTEVKRGIKKTLETTPDEFAYFHNGITIVCKRIEKSGSKVLLHSPSIVNGAQTVTYLGESLAGKIPKEASVLVKVIEVLADGGFEEFETDIAMSSNTQNKVSLSDLSVIDPDLVKIERFFRASKCFLERKRGDSPLGTTFLKINKDRLLQLFVSLDRKTGPAATKDKQALYSHHSGRLFEEYAATIDRKRDAVFLAMLDKFVKVSLGKFKRIGKGNKRKKRRLSLSYFTIYALVSEFIAKKKMWYNLRQAFASEGIFQNQYSDRLDRDVRIVAAAVLALAKKDPDRNETAFFKNRDKVKKCINQLSRRLSSRISFHRS